MREATSTAALTAHLRALGVDVHTYRHPTTHRFEACEWGDHDPQPPATCTVIAGDGMHDICPDCAVSRAKSAIEDTGGRVEDITVEIAQLVPAALVGGA